MIATKNEMHLNLMCRNCIAKQCNELPDGMN